MLAMKVYLYHLAFDEVMQSESLYMRSIQAKGPRILSHYDLQKCNLSNSLVNLPNFNTIFSNGFSTSIQNVQT